MVGGDEPVQMAAEVGLAIDLDETFGEHRPTADLDGVGRDGRPGVVGHA